MPMCTPIMRGHSYTTVHEKMSLYALPHRARAIFSVHVGYVSIGHIYHVSQLDFRLIFTLMGHTLIPDSHSKLASHQHRIPKKMYRN